MNILIVVYGIYVYCLHVINLNRSVAYVNLNGIVNLRINVNRKLWKKSGFPQSWKVMEKKAVMETEENK